MLKIARFFSRAICTYSTLVLDSYIMKRAHFRFDEDLRALLPLDRSGGDFVYDFNGPQSCKHLIESVGIPHTEIGSILAGNLQVTLGYLVADGDSVHVFACAPATADPSEPRFVADGHLGRLVSHLRMLGVDCLYRNDYDDESLTNVSVAEGRILLTRDRRLLMRKMITLGCLIRSLDPREQLDQVVRRYGLRSWIRPFQRCIRCNHLLKEVNKADILDRLEVLTRLYFEEFHICPACRQIYWKGSHFDKMQKLISELTRAPGSRDDSLTA
jgi:uncharacterized protein